MTTTTRIPDPARLLALKMEFDAWQKAEIGFNVSLISLFDAGYTKRELAIGLGLLPRDVDRILDRYGPGIRKFIKEVQLKTIKEETANARNTRKSAGK
jgi:hypothetical protein